MEFNLLIGKKQEYENPNAEIEGSILTEYAKNFDVETTIVHNCKDYTTLKYKDYDIARLKYGNISKWIQIFILDRKKYIDNLLFEAQKNKNQIMWKSIINTIEDLDKYTDILKETIEKLNK